MGLTQNMIMYVLNACFILSALCRSHLYSEHGLRAEGLELFLRVGVVVPLVALERGLLLGQRARLLVETGVDDVCALLLLFNISTRDITLRRARRIPKGKRGKERGQALTPW